MTPGWLLTASPPPPRRGAGALGGPSGRRLKPGVSESDRRYEEAHWWPRRPCSSRACKPRKPRAPSRTPGTDGPGGAILRRGQLSRASPRGCPRHCPAAVIRSADSFFEEAGAMAVGAHFGPNGLEATETQHHTGAPPAITVICCEGPLFPALLAHPQMEGPTQPPQFRKSAAETARPCPDAMAPPSAPCAKQNVSLRCAASSTRQAAAL